MVHQQLIQMATAYRVSQAVYCAAALRLPEHLAAGPKSAAELAAATKAHAPSLHRLMRVLASLGLLADAGERRYALTPLGKALEGPTRASVLTLVGTGYWRAWEHLLYSVRTGETGWEKAWGNGFFDYFSERPEEASLFSETMVAFHSEEPPAVAEAYDFSAFAVVADVGGAIGNMLAAILARHPGVRGLLYDLPHVVRDAPSFLEGKGVRERVAISGGSFFESVPGGADAYLLSHVLHDWPDDRCVQILKNCRAAMAPGATLLVVEMLIPPGDAPHPAKMLDLSMLVGTSGLERTVEEYETLLRACGFRFTRTVPTASAVTVVEAKAL